MSGRRALSAFTLVEITVATAVLLILVTLAVFSLAPARDRAELARCVANLRSLYTGFSTYVSDQGQWPQVDENLTGHPYESFWKAAVRPYGITDENWKCPTLTRNLLELEEKDRPLIHYTPTHFDEKALTPYKWPQQPWLIEISDAHGKGNMTILTSGAVRTFDEIFIEAGGEPVEW